MLPPDLSGRRAEGVLTDPRVVHLYDGQRLASQWFAENVNLEGPERSALGRTFDNLEWGEYVWDSYFLYGPEAVWEDSLPSALQSGYPIINRREEIRMALGVDIASVTADTTGATAYEIVSQESLVSYGVEETLAGRKFNYAIGVTNSIAGQMTIDPERPSASEVAPITVTIQDFSSDNFLRDERIQQEFLESARFPIATFTATELQGLPDSYTMGETITFEIMGDLEIRETVVPTTFNVEAKLENGRLSGTATSQILMTDFGFEPPSLANLIQTENEVDITFEFVAQPSTP
jgi:polyisoprenoid-binding protein YceI